MLKGVSSGLDLPLLPRLWKFGKKSNLERNLTNSHRSRYRACGNSEGNLERNSENTKTIKHLMSFQISTGAAAPVEIRCFLQKLLLYYFSFLKRLRTVCKILAV